MLPASLHNEKEKKLSIPRHKIARIFFPLWLFHSLVSTVNRFVSRVNEVGTLVHFWFLHCISLRVRLSFSLFLILSCSFLHTHDIWMCLLLWMPNTSHHLVHLRWIESVPQKKNRFSVVYKSGWKNECESERARERNGPWMCECAMKQEQQQQQQYGSGCRWLHTYNSETCLLHLAVPIYSYSSRTLLLITRARYLCRRHINRDCLSLFEWFRGLKGIEQHKKYERNIKKYIYRHTHTSWARSLHLAWVWSEDFFLFLHTPYTHKDTRTQNSYKNQHKRQKMLVPMLVLVVARVKRLSTLMHNA